LVIQAVFYRSDRPGCHHARFIGFCNAWKAAHPSGSKRPTAAEIDNRLHAERIAADRSERMFTAALDGLPDGVFVTLEGGQGRPPARLDAGGYGERRARPKGETVSVLAPPSTVAAMRAGYIPARPPLGCNLTSRRSAPRGPIST
jgi:hypothetical protein